MIPRTVQMAAAVKALFSATELQDYGNIILNGYATTIPNTINKKAWQYQETTTPPVDLPNLVVYRPAMKGWTTNYMEYYTRAQAGYSFEPGDPTMFATSVHSFGVTTGSILTLGTIAGGSGYTPGTYNGVAITSSIGSGATANITVGASGEVTAVVLVGFGTGYQQWQTVSAATATIGGTGSGFFVYVAAISPLAGGNPGWSRPPVRFNQQQVLPTSTTQPLLNNPAAIQYSFIHPIADNTTEPPIDIVVP